MTLSNAETYINTDIVNTISNDIAVCREHTGECDLEKNYPNKDKASFDVHCREGKKTIHIVNQNISGFEIKNTLVGTKHYNYSNISFWKDYTEEICEHKLQRLTRISDDKYKYFDIGDPDAASSIRNAINDFIWYQHLSSYTKCLRTNKSKVECSEHIMNIIDLDKKLRPKFLEMICTKSSKACIEIANNNRLAMIKRLEAATDVTMLHNIIEPTLSLSNNIENYLNNQLTLIKNDKVAKEDYYDFLVRTNNMLAGYSIAKPRQGLSFISKFIKADVYQQRQGPLNSYYNTLLFILIKRHGHIDFRSRKTISDIILYLWYLQEDQHVYTESLLKSLVPILKDNEASMDIRILSGLLHRLASLERPKEPLDKHAHIQLRTLLNSIDPLCVIFKGKYSQLEKYDRDMIMSIYKKAIKWAKLTRYSPSYYVSPISLSLSDDEELHNEFLDFYIKFVRKDMGV